MRRCGSKTWVSGCSTVGDGLLPPWKNFPWAAETLRFACHLVQPLFLQAISRACSKCISAKISHLSHRQPYACRRIVKHSL